jgi:MinD superfamily P-loop ATPase
MHEITIISGKGGTGKTSVTAAFASLAANHVVCDLDVDAADMHLILDPNIQEKHDFISGNEAIINAEQCVSCGMCADICKFNAISFDDKASAYKVNPFKCEGCGVCVHFCPSKAIDFPSKHCGQWYVSKTRFADMVHAELFPGEENSGLLVTQLRKKAKEIAEKKAKDIILCDGSPGIGCPVIASITGTNLAVVVTEPTPSGQHDMERVVSLCKKFNVPVQVIVNKYDLNNKKTKEIENYCQINDISVIAYLPYDVVFVNAMVSGKNIIEFDAEHVASKMLEEAWTKIERKLNK